MYLNGVEDGFEGDVIGDEETHLAISAVQA